MTSSSLTRQVLAQEIVDRYAEEWLAQTLSVYHKHRRNFANIAQRFPSHLGDDVKQHFKTMVKIVLNDGIVNSTRIVTVFAFAIYLQEIYSIDLKDEVESLVDEWVFDGLLRRRGDDEQSGINVPNSYHMCDWAASGALTLLCIVVAND